MYTSSAADAFRQVGPVQEGKQPCGPQHQANTAASTVPPDRNWCRDRWRSRPVVTLGKALGGEEGPEMSTHTSSRRRGGGTYGRSVVLKQGRSRGQPRSGRRAQTRGITRHPGKSAGVVETGGSGRRSVEGRDNTTLLEQRTRGLRWSCRAPEAGGVDNPHHKGKRAGRGRRPYQTADLRGVCRPGA